MNPVPASRGYGKMRELERLTREAIDRGEHVHWADQYGSHCLTGECSPPEPEPEQP